MIGSSRQQYGNDVARTQGAGHEQVAEPRGLALRFMRHDGLLGASDHDDVLSDAMYGIAKAVATWDDRDGEGVSLVTWCWWSMRHAVAHGRRHRSRFTREDPTDWASAPGDWHPELTEHGYKQVEDRVLLQRWADMAYLSDLQADMLAWLAAYGGQHGRAPGGHWIPNPMRGRSSVVNSGLARLRRVAVTGKPFVRWGGCRDTGSIAPQVTDADVCAAVTG